MSAVRSKASEPDELTIELDAYALPHSHKVYKCFPGEGYKFYDVVEKESVAFLDIRGLDELPANPAAWDEPEIERVIEWDLASRGPRRSGQKRRRRQSGTIKRNANFVKGLLLEVKRGALIVVPPPGYRRDVLIGEVMDDPGTPVQVRATDGEHVFTYLGRRVKWLARIEKRLLKREVLDRLHTAQAFFHIGDSLQEDIYSVAFENYVWRDKFVATFRTEKLHFSAADNLVSSIWFNGLVAVDQAAGSGRALDTRSYVEAALQAEGARGNELELNINSPGTILMRTAGPLALASMAMLPLSPAEASQVANGEARITLKALGGSDPTCQLQVEAAVADYVRSLGPELLLEQCEFGKKAREEATLKAKVHLKKRPKKHK